MFHVNTHTHMHTIPLSWGHFPKASVPQELSLVECFKLPGDSLFPGLHLMLHLCNSSPHWSFGIEIFFLFQAPLILIFRSSSHILPLFHSGLWDLFSVSWFPLLAILSSLYTLCTFRGEKKQFFLILLLIKAHSIFRMCVCVQIQELWLRTF